MATSISLPPHTCPIPTLASFAAGTSGVAAPQFLAKHSGFAGTAQALAAGLPAHFNLTNPEVFYKIPLSIANPTLGAWFKSFFVQKPSPQLVVRRNALQGAPNSPYLNGLDANSLAQLSNLLAAEITRIAKDINSKQNAAEVFVNLKVVVVDQQEMLSILGYPETDETTQEEALEALPVWLQSDGTVVVNAEAALDHAALSTHAQKALSLAFKLHHAQHQIELKQTFENTDPEITVLGAKSLGHLAQGVFTQSTWAAQKQTAHTITPPPAYQRAASLAVDFERLAVSSLGKPIRNEERLLAIVAVQEMALGLDAWFQQPPGFFLSVIDQIKFVTEPGQSGIAYVFGPATEKHLKLPKNIAKAFASYAELQQYLVLALTQAKQDFRLQYCDTIGHTDYDLIEEQAKKWAGHLTQKELKLIYHDVTVGLLGNALGRWLACHLNPKQALTRNPGNEYVYSGRMSPLSPLDYWVFEALRTKYTPKEMAEVFFKPQEQTEALDKDADHYRLCRQVAKDQRERAAALAMVLQGLFELRHSTDPNKPMKVTRDQLLEFGKSKENQEPTSTDTVAKIMFPVHLINWMIRYPAFRNLLLSRRPFFL